MQNQDMQNQETRDPPGGRNMSTDPPGGRNMSTDPPGGRNMSQPTAVHHRRKSGSTSASSVAASGSSVNPKEDHQTPPQPDSSSPGPQPGSSSPGPPQHSTAPQSQSVMKKKSGFQITSVTPAQMSTNNSIADDTESYDDMDESHTEDLSSSDMLDVSVSRATDTGLPERSSSDETLNSLQSAETPGLVSPNEPLHPHSLPAVSLHQQLVNGMPHLPQLPPCVESVEAVVPVPSQARRPPSPAPPPPASLADTHHNTSLAQANATAGSNTLLSSGPLAQDSAVQGLSTGGGPGGPAGVPTTQTQSNPGSRFRVVKLDSNSEPYRKGRWMCTEYYEKEVPPADARPGEALPPDREPAGVTTASAPQTLQPYQQHTQDFTSPQATQNLPALVQSTPLTGPHDPGTILVQAGQPSLASSIPSAPQVGTQAPSGVVQHLAYAVDAQPACGGYPAQLSTGPLAMAGGRQPDFIQPTAPFQAQAQAPLAPAPTGASVVGLGGASQPLQGHAPSTQPAFAPAQPSSSPRAPAHSTTYLPLTSLQADLQPLLTHGLALSQAHSGAAHLGSMPSLTASQLQDAQRLLFQYQGLAGLPRLGVTGGGEPGAEARAAGVQGRGEAGSDGRAAGGLAYMGDAVSALRSQPADEEEDRSSGASVVAIDNKIEQAMDLVKSHLMYAVREEVEVLKEQIKELVERNSQLEQENSLLKALASPEQMAQFQAQVEPESPTDSTQAIAPSQPPSTSA